MRACVLPFSFPFFFRGGGPFFEKSTCMNLKISVGKCRNYLGPFVLVSMPTRKGLGYVPLLNIQPKPIDSWLYQNGQNRISGFTLTFMIPGRTTSWQYSTGRYNRSNLTHAERLLRHCYGTSGSLLGAASFEVKSTEAVDCIQSLLDYWQALDQAAPLTVMNQRPPSKATAVF